MNDSNKLGYTLDDLRRLANTEPNRARRAQYAAMLKQAQSEMQKSDKTYALWVKMGNKPPRIVKTFTVQGESQALEQAQAYASANGFPRYVSRAPHGSYWGQWESRDGKSLLRLGFPDRVADFEEPSGYGTSEKAASAPMSKGASEVENILRQYLNKDVRVRLFYGDKNTGRDWGEEYSVMGTIGQSMGPQKALLLINNRRSMGGDAISLDSVVKIMVGGKVVYQHPKYNQGEYTIGQAPGNAGNLTVGVFNDGKNVANFTDKVKAQRWIDYMTGKRNSKAAPAPMRKADGGVWVNSRGEEIMAGSLSYNWSPREQAVMLEGLTPDSDPDFSEPVEIDTIAWRDDHDKKFNGVWDKKGQFNPEALEFLSVTPEDEQKYMPKLGYRLKTGKAQGAGMQKAKVQQTEAEVFSGKLKPNDVYVSHHTEEDGKVYWTAIVQGQPICPSWPDEERVRKVAESFHFKQGKGGNIYLWDGDKGKFSPYDRQIDAKEAGRPQINSAPYRR